MVKPLLVIILAQFLIGFGKSLSYTNTTGEIRATLPTPNCKIWVGPKDPECGAPVENSGVKFLSFPIPVTSDTGSKFNIMNIVYDTKKKTPVSSTSFYNHEYNTAKFERPGPSDWKIWGCKGYVEPDCQTPFGNRYDRGHLTEVAKWKFTDEHACKTFFCVNQAPQVDGFNRNAWRLKAEEPSREIALTRSGFIMTGVCEAGINIPSDKDRHYPSCFWRMVCSINGKGTAEVVGYYGQNIDNPAIEILSQREIVKRMGSIYGTTVEMAWRDANNRLRENRDILNKPAPSAQQCIAALDLPKDTQQYQNPSKPSGPFDKHTLVDEPPSASEFKNDAYKSNTREDWNKILRKRCRVDYGTASLKSNSILTTLPSKIKSYFRKPNPAFRNQNSGASYIWSSEKLPMYVMVLQEGKMGSGKENIYDVYNCEEREAQMFVAVTLDKDGYPDRWGGQAYSQLATGNLTLDLSKCKVVK